MQACVCALPLHAGVNMCAAGHVCARISNAPIQKLKAFSQRKPVFFLVSFQLLTLETTSLHLGILQFPDCTAPCIRNFKMPCKHQRINFYYLRKLGTGGYPYITHKLLKCREVPMVCLLVNQCGSWEKYSEVPAHGPSPLFQVSSQVNLNLKKCVSFIIQQGPGCFFSST